MKSIFELNDQFKLNFVLQINNNELEKELFNFLNSYYLIGHVKAPYDSCINIVNKIMKDLNITFENINKIVIQTAISEKYKRTNDGLIDSIRSVLNITWHNTININKTTMLS